MKFQRRSRTQKVRTYQAKSRFRAGQTWPSMERKERERKNKIYKNCLSLSVSLSLSLSVSVSVCFSFSLSVCVCLYLLLFLSVCLCLFLSVSLYLCLSVLLLLLLLKIEFWSIMEAKFVKIGSKIFRKSIGKASRAPLRLQGRILFDFGTEIKIAPKID